MFALLYTYSFSAMTNTELPTVTVTGTCTNCVNMESYYRYLDRNDPLLSTTMDADGAGSGWGWEEVSAQSDVAAARKVVEGIDPPCPKQGESATAYQARATKYCVGIVQDAFPMLTKTLAATACTSMNPKIALAFQGEGSCKG